MALRFGRDKEFMIKHADLIFYHADQYYNQETGKNFLHQTFVYLMNVAPILENNWGNIIKKLPKPIKNKAMTLYDSILLKGKAEGKQLTLQIAKKLKHGEHPENIAKELDVDINFVMTIKKELNL